MTIGRAGGLIQCKRYKKFGDSRAVPKCLAVSQNLLVSQRVVDFLNHQLPAFFRIHAVGHDLGHVVLKDVAALVEQGVLGLGNVGVQVDDRSLGQLLQQSVVSIGISGIGGSALAGYVVGRSGGPVKLLSGGGQEGSQLESGVLLSLGVALGTGDDQGSAGNILMVGAVIAVGLVGNTNFEGHAVGTGLSLILVAGVYGGGVQRAGTGAGGEVQQQGVANIVDNPGDVALVNPLAQLLDQVQRNIALQTGGVGLGIDHESAHVGEQAVEVSVVSAVNVDNGLSGGVIHGLKEAAHLFRLGGEGQAQFVEQGLIVIEDLARLAEWQSSLVTVVVHHRGHALIEISKVDFIGKGFVYTQESVTDCANMHLKYDAFYALGDLSLLVPGLNQGFVQQGLSYLPEKNWVIIAGYSGNSNVNSMLFVVDLVTGEMAREVMLQYSDGTDYFGHAGGVAVTEKNIFIANNGHLYRIALGKFISLTPSAFCTFDEEISVPSRASYCSYADDVLWVGEFQYDPRYKTDRTHWYKNKDGRYKAWLIGYELDPSQENEIKTAALAAETATPDYIISTTDRI